MRLAKAKRTAQRDRTRWYLPDKVNEIQTRIRLKANRTNYDGMVVWSHILKLSLIILIAIRCLLLKMLRYITTTNYSNRYHFKHEYLTKILSLSSIYHMTYISNIIN